MHRPPYVDGMFDSIAMRCFHPSHIPPQYTVHAGLAAMVVATLFTAS